MYSYVLISHLYFFCELLFASFAYFSVYLTFSEKFLWAIYILSINSSFIILVAISVPSPIDFFSLYDFFHFCLESFLLFQDQISSIVSASLKQNVSFFAAFNPSSRIFVWYKMTFEFYFFQLSLFQSLLLTNPHCSCPFLIPPYCTL